MRIEKIKAVKCDGSLTSQPATLTTLGFKVEDRTFLLGSFYDGFGCDPSHLEEERRVERIVDALVAMSQYKD